MKNVNLPYLDEIAIKTITIELQELLLNYQTFITNIRFFCENIKKDNLYQLHEKLKEIHDKSVKRTREIEERIFILGETITASHNDNLPEHEIKRSNFAGSDNEYIEQIIQNLSTLINIERNIISTATKNKDCGTVALMSNFILEQEKDSWKFTTYLSWTKRISLS